ncbi:MAG: biotin--[acetyl-CoA-carboxylase] ligase [Acidobacteriota bacterium]
MRFSLHYFDSLDSTNTKALEMARAGSDEGTCVIARQQTAGRGRLGRRWESPPDSGLYFSIILYPRLASAFMPLITLMTGIAVSDTVAEFGLKPDIKWVNDILVGEKKICGILAETTDTPRGPAVVVGIGINIDDTGFPPELAGSATSIEAETGSRPDRDALIEILFKSIADAYERLKGADGARLTIDNWQQRSSYSEGKEVSVINGNEIIEGTTDGLEKNGALRVLKANGEVAIIHAGDVGRLRALPK